MHGGEDRSICEILVNINRTYNTTIVLISHLTPNSPRRGTRCVSTGLTQAIAAGRSAGIGSGQRCAVRPAALDGELPPSSPGALFESGVGTDRTARRSQVCRGQFPTPSPNQPNPNPRTRSHIHCTV